MFIEEKLFKESDTISDTRNTVNNYSLISQPTSMQIQARSICEKKIWFDLPDSKNGKITMVIFFQNYR